MTARATAHQDRHKTAAGGRFWDQAATAAQPAAARTVLLVSADAGLRRRLGDRLTALRWRVREAASGSEALLQLDAQPVEAMLVDSWLPDLEVGEFAAHVRLQYPETDLLALDGATAAGRLAEASARGGQDRGDASPRRNELLLAIREAHDPSLAVRTGDGPPRAHEGALGRHLDAYRVRPDGSVTDGTLTGSGWMKRNGAPQGPMVQGRRAASPDGSRPARDPGPGSEGLPSPLAELVGGSEAMGELRRLIELVAVRPTPVLIEGETGTGKELVARALHRLSGRANKSLAVLNCAAIPESLLESELFGHVRGAFTGAMQSRVGRIEAAQGGTLLLDEIGEMPLGMQAKMLRFLESGELQRIGENENLHVDVRLIAATHRPLEQMSNDGTFRLDLYHRLAVFPIEVPPLRRRMEDLPALTEHFLASMGRESARKWLSPAAAARLLEHDWPGNVRELMHVLERAAILAGPSSEIAVDDIRYRRKQRPPEVSPAS